MHSCSLVAIARNLTFLFALALVSASCGSAEHVAPNSVNVLDEIEEPHNSLYRHHDIMLHMKWQSDVFGLVEGGPELMEEYLGPEQEPALAERPSRFPPWRSSLVLRPARLAPRCARPWRLLNSGAFVSISRSR